MKRNSVYNGVITLKSLADRSVRIKIDHDETKKIFAELIEVDPGVEHNCRSNGGEVCLSVPRRFKNGRTQATSFMAEFYQYVEAEEKVSIPFVTEPQKTGLSGLNPEKDEPKKAKGTLFEIQNNRFSQKAIEKAQKRKNDLLKKRQDFDEARALKPIGLDDRRVITGDDVGYSKAPAIISWLILHEKELNKDIKSESEKKLINEFYDCFVFSGISCIIGLYLTLGKKSIGGGSIEYLLKWWINNFRYAFSLTPAQNAKARIVGMFKGKEAGGLSEKNARKLLEGLFINPRNQEQFTLADINQEVYQPLIFDDMRSRAYTRGGTPDIKLVDVAMNCGIDPKLFHTKQTEEIGKSIGSFRRSFDLPLAQHNNNISITSIGVPLRFQPPKKNNANTNQMTEISREANYMTDYHDTIQHMWNNQHNVKFIRIESQPMDGFSNYSVSADNLRYAVECGKRAEIVSQSQKLLN